MGLEGRHIPHRAVSLDEIKASCPTGHGDFPVVSPIISQIITQQKDVSSGR